MKMNELIRTKRKELNMTQLELALKIGLNTPQQLNNIEHSISPMPLKRLKKLCKVLGVSKKQVLEVLVNDYRNKIDSEYLK